MNKKIAIIGGGAAGMMVAATFLERSDFDGEVHLFEKNSRLGTKVIISGGGRCNVTTGTVKIKELLEKYPRGAVFITPALKQFGPRSIRRRFEEHGVPLKQEEDLRVFPISDDGKDIVLLFERLFKGNKKMHLHLKEGCTHIERAKNIAGFTVTTDKQTYTYDTIVLAPGGNAYAHTGSAGDGYARARSLGHTITPLGPSLNSFLTEETWIYELSGTAFPDAMVKGVLATGTNPKARASKSIVDQSTHAEKISSRGPVLLTHFGISGPATFAFSSYLPYIKIDREHPYILFFQPDASKTMHHRQEFFIEATTSSSKKELATILIQYFTKKFVQALLVHFQFNPHQQLAQLSKAQRHHLCQLLGEGIPLTLIQRKPGDEFVTAGGVTLSEVNPETGESKLTAGLYFAGEILDIDGHTGGYNFTSSWAMGRLVGKSIL